MQIAEFERFILYFRVTFPKRHNIKFTTIKYTMPGKKNSRVNYYHITFQWGIFLLLGYMVLRSFWDKNYAPDFEAYCPFGGMQSLASYFSSHSLACSMTTVQIALGISLLLAVVLLSKLFCSYICPIGTFTEWIGKLGRKAKMQKTLSGNADRLLRALKYVLLFITFYFTVTASELFCRVFEIYQCITATIHGLKVAYN